MGALLKHFKLIYTCALCSANGNNLELIWQLQFDCKIFAQNSHYVSAALMHSFGRIFTVFYLRNGKVKKRTSQAVGGRSGNIPNDVAQTWTWILNGNKLVGLGQ